MRQNNSQKKKKNTKETQSVIRNHPPKKNPRPDGLDDEFCQHLKKININPSETLPKIEEGTLFKLIS